MMPGARHLQPPSMPVVRGAAAALALAFIGAPSALLAAGRPLTDPQPEAATAIAAAPQVSKVEPPDWWVGHSINPVRLLVRGRDLGGARAECARLRCGAVTVNAAGTYAFVDVTIPAGTRPGAYPLALRTAGGRATIPFTVHAPLARAGRFRGFDANDVTYLIMPDRFANGDPSNDDPAESRGQLDRTNPRAYHGGDLAGIRARLPYLRRLGVTTLWLNPIYDNRDRQDSTTVYDRKPMTDYHGYGAIDYYAVEEHFGDLAELRRLVDAAHAQGIKIMLDMVANHVGPDHPWVDDPPTPTWFNGTRQRHLDNTWQTWTLADPYAAPALRESTVRGWFAGILPDLNQDDPEVRRYLIQNTLWWVGQSGIDAIRQDTWPYAPRDFWRDWIAAIKREYPSLRVVGEVLEGDPTLVSFFQGGRRQFDGIDDGVDALFDYPTHFPARRAFGEGRPLKELAQMLGRDHVYPNPDMLMTFLGNHDVSRQPSDSGNTTAGLKLGFTWLATNRGVPLLYYGEEIGLPGRGDPDNRRDFPGGFAGDARNAFEASGRTAAEQEVWSHLQRLLALRAARPDLRTGRTTHLHVTDQQFVYRRGRTVVALNNDTAAAEVRLPATTLPAAASDALGACAAPRREGDTVVVRIPARAGCIF